MHARRRLPDDQPGRFATGQPGSDGRTDQSAVNLSVAQSYRHLVKIHQNWILPHATGLRWAGQQAGNLTDAAGERDRAIEKKTPQPAH